MSYVTLGSSSTSSQTRPQPTYTGFQWIQVNSSSLPIERWTWNGSVYMSDLKLHSLPVDDVNYTSSGKLWAIGITPGFGLYLTNIRWTPILTPGTYNMSNFWGLSVSEFQSSNSSPTFSTELATPAISLTDNTNVPLTKTLNRTVGSGVVKIRLTIFRIGIPPNISHGWIGLEYRLTTP